MRMLVIASVLVVSLSWAKNKDTHSSDYPEKGHVVSAVFTHTPHSSYDPQSGHSTYGASNMRTTEIQIGPLIYITSGLCKEAQVGSEYPAQLDKKGIKLLVGDMVCNYRIEGSREK